MSWSERIKGIRKFFGWSQADLGRRLMVTPTCIWQWEMERSEPGSLSRLILDRLGRNVDRGERLMYSDDTAEFLGQLFSPEV